MNRNDRVISYFQDEWNRYKLTHDFLNTGSDRIDNPPSFSKFIDKTVDKFTLENPVADVKEHSPVDVLFTLRDLSPESLKRYIEFNKKDIKGKEIRALFNINEDVHITSPTGENILMNLSCKIFSNELKRTSLEGLSVLVDSNSNIIKEPIYIKTNYSKSIVRRTTNRESRILNLAKLFYSINRRLFEFESGDIFYSKKEDSYKLYDKELKDKIVKDLIKGDITFILDEGSLKSLLQEYGLCSYEHIS